MSHWHENAIVYSIYPLGAVNKKHHNDYVLSIDGIPALAKWVDHIAALGCNTVSFAPVFESISHGYDTTDYRKIDSRLGTNQQFAQLVRQCHDAGLRVVLDGVFNHTGRDFFAFQDLQQNGEGSQYQDWYQGVSFHEKSPLGDFFTYEAWRGHFELPRLNPHCAAAREYLYESVRMWIKEFDIDGIRLDCADCLDFGFMSGLRSLCLGENPDFWLMGEIIHGDYTRWANPSTLHSVTNYECYKGLYSSHNDGNLHEIAYSLGRQFGSGGIYKDLLLYNFADNHDVDRLADTVKREEFLFTVYTLLYTMPGIPSVYYGSEWGIRGKTDRVTDWNLRPYVDIDTVQQNNPALMEHIKALAAIRMDSEAIRHGRYEQIAVSSHQFAFRRRLGGEEVIVVINIANRTQGISLNLSDCWLSDLLQGGETFIPEGGAIAVGLPPFGSRILRKHRSDEAQPVTRQTAPPVLHMPAPATPPTPTPMPATPPAPAPTPMPAPPPAPVPEPVPAPPPVPEPQPLEQEGVKVVRIEHLPAKKIEQHPTYTHERRDAFETDRLSVRFYQLPPGKSAYPYHWHTGREEVFYILSGSGLLRTPQGERQVGAGDLIHFPPGEAGAHRLINTTHEPLRYIDFDALVQKDACVYPDSNKVNLGPGKIYRLGDPAGYYDGE